MPDENLPKPPQHWNIEPPAPESSTTESAKPAPEFPVPIEQNGPGKPGRGVPAQEVELPQPSPMPPHSTPSPIASQLSPEPEDGSQRLPYWLSQSERFLRVVVRMYLGLLVCCAPWYAPAWDANPLFASSPHLLAFISNGAVRGVVSGLGLLNLWIALRDALRGPTDSDSDARQR